MRRYSSKTVLRIESRKVLKLKIKIIKKKKLTIFFVAFVLITFFQITRQETPEIDAPTNNCFLLFNFIQAAFNSNNSSMYRLNPKIGDSQK